MKTCPKCNNIHSKDGTFCSRSCANSRGPRSLEFKNIVSNKLSGRKGHNVNKGKIFVERITANCQDCGKEFQFLKTQSRKFCSILCRNKQSGGYREGSGRSKSGYYKGIYCGSTYELVWLIYQLDHHQNFSRFSGCLISSITGKKYYPDFLQNGKIVEIKGFENPQSVEEKSNIAREHGYDVIVKRKNDLTIEFNWVQSNYTFKSLQELYDGYKPKYNYTCSCCKTIFTTDIKKKTTIVFCSRQCAGKGHKGRVLSSHR